MRTLLALLLLAGSVASARPRNAHAQARRLNSAVTVTADIDWTDFAGSPPGVFRYVVPLGGVLPPGAALVSIAIGDGAFVPFTDSDEDNFFAAVQNADGDVTYCPTAPLGGSNIPGVPLYEDQGAGVAQGPDGSLVTCAGGGPVGGAQLYLVVGPGTPWDPWLLQATQGHLHASFTYLP